MSDLEGKHIVQYTRYGALLYYPADNYDDALRFVRIYTQIGEIQLLDIIAPGGDHYTIPTEEQWVDHKPTPHPR